MMGWYTGAGWGVGSWIGMGLGMVVFWGLIIVGIVALLRWTAQGRPAPGGPGAPPEGTSATALQTLDERLARGEITVEDYQRTREILQGR